MNARTRYSIIAVVVASQFIAGCGSTQSSESMSVFSDGVQGPVVTAPAVAVNTLDDGSAQTQSLGLRTYSRRALDLINKLKPVSFSFLDSGELYSFSTDGADPVVVAAGGRMVLDSVTLNTDGEIVAWEFASGSSSQDCQIVVTVVPGPPRQTLYSCNTIDCDETCVPTWIQVDELFYFTCACPATP